MFVGKNLPVKDGVSRMSGPITTHLDYHSVPLQVLHARDIWTSWDKCRENKTVRGKLVVMLHVQICREHGRGKEGRRSRGPYGHCLQGTYSGTDPTVFNIQ